MSKKKAKKMGLWQGLTSLVTLLVLLGIGWWAYITGYIGDYQGGAEELKVLELSATDGESVDWPVLVKTWDFEKKKDIRYENGGWAKRGFNQAKLADGVLTAQIASGSSWMRGASTVVKLLREENLVASASSIQRPGYKLVMRMAVSPAGKGDFMTEQLTKDYQYVEGKVLVYGIKQNGLGKWNRKTELIEEVVDRVEAVPVGQFFEMEFDLGVIFPKETRVTKLLWYPVTDFEQGEDSVLGARNTDDLMEIKQGRGINIHGGIKNYNLMLDLDSIALWQTQGTMGYWPED